MATQFSAVGERYTYASLLDTAGYAAGSSATLANGATSGSMRLKGVHQVGVTLPQTRDIAIEADNTNLGSIKIPGNANATGQLLTRIKDPTFTTKAQGLLINTVGNTDFTIAGVPCPTFAPMVIIVNAPAINQTTGSVGVPGFEVTIYNNCQVAPREVTQISDAQVHEYTHDLLAGYADRAAWGPSITNVLYNANRAIQHGPFFSLYPMTLQAFRGDAAVTTTTLDETPAGYDASNIMVWEDGIIKAYTTYYTGATNIITYAAAPTAGKKVQILYKFIPSC